METEKREITLEMVRREPKKLTKFTNKGHNTKLEFYRKNKKELKALIYKS